MLVIPFENGEFFRRESTKTVFVSAEFRPIREERYPKNSSLSTSLEGIECRQRIQAVGEESEPKTILMSKEVRWAEGTHGLIESLQGKESSLNGAHYHASSAWASRIKVVEDVHGQPHPLSRVLLGLLQSCELRSELRRDRIRGHRPTCSLDCRIFS
ncbi:hypothetical protein AB7M23_003333 [Pseudomonas sp. HLS-6 TE3448]